jgi:hypothetical protein
MTNFHVNSLKKRFIIIIVLLFTHLSIGAELQIEKNEVFKSVLSEMNYLGSSPEIYAFSEKYRLDLTLVDLVDQVSILAEDYPNLNDTFKTALQSHEGHLNFLNWWSEVKKIAQTNEDFREKLDQNLYMQFYSPTGMALIPDYKIIDFKKLSDHSKLMRIKKYNNFSNDPEGQGLHLLFKHLEKKDFYTGALTVTKLKKIAPTYLRKIRVTYYNVLIDLYKKHDPNVSFHRGRFGLKTKESSSLNTKSVRLFNLIHTLPDKNQVLFFLSQNIKHLPSENGFIILTPSFIQEHFDEIETHLKEFTLLRLLRSDDDQYLLSLRNYIQKNIETIEKDLSDFNSKEGSDLKIVWTNRQNKPQRIEAMANLDILLKLYPDSPWIEKDHGTLFNRKGKEVFFHKNALSAVGHFFKKLGTDLIQTETYSSLLAGTTALILTNGNLPVAVSTQKLVKKAIATHRYNKEWEEFLKNAPKDVLDMVLLSSGAGAGRFYKIFAMGGAQGFIQSFMTGQNLVTGAATGAGLNLIQYYVLPQNFSRPMSRSYDARALQLNRRLELLEKTVKSSLQGTVVATLEGEDILKGALKGGAYGFISTKVLIWFVGTRYNPFKGWSDELVDNVIEWENWYQNIVGRGGEYAIDRQLILDSNFRVGGVLPEWISASITLPGSVAMGPSAFNQLTTLTHEASHLMQQHQSGVFGFYLFRYLPTALFTGYYGHPDENFLYRLIGLF